MADPTPLREGFVLEAPPHEEAPRDAGPRDTPPLPPLPSQLKSEQPAPEPPLSEPDAVRSEIAAAAESWPITVKLLYKPIRNDKGEQVNSLTFRQPRASEINRIGNPTRLLWDGEIVIEERKMTYIMAALSGVLPPLLDDMDPRDWNSCALRLRKFFLPDLRAWS
jgi:Phage tail assembly chaperone proteins, E, or 41 or 14